MSDNTLFIFDSKVDGMERAVLKNKTATAVDIERPVRVPQIRRDVYNPVFWTFVLSFLGIIGLGLIYFSLSEAYKLKNIPFRYEFLALLGFAIVFPLLFTIPMLLYQLKHYNKAFHRLSRVELEDEPVKEPEYTKTIDRPNYKQYRREQFVLNREHWINMSIEFIDDEGFYIGPNKLNRTHLREIAGVKVQNKFMPNYLEQLKRGNFLDKGGFVQDKFIEKLLDIHPPTPREGDQKTTNG
jgi:hypothetical protein